MELVEKLKATKIDRVETRALTGSVLANAGYFCNIYESNYNDLCVSVKTFLDISKKSIHVFLRELNLLHALQSDNLIKLYGYIVDTDLPFPLYGIVTESTSISLRYFLNEKPNLCYNIRTKMMLGAAKGLCTLHNMYSMPILHKNLSSVSFYVFGDNYVKIGSCMSNRISKEVNFIAYFAYEILKDIFAEYTIKAEIYSFGVVLWEILTGDIPLKNMNYKDIYHRLIREKRGEYMPLDSPLELQNLITACRAVEPSHRPNTRTIVNFLETFCMKILNE